MSATVLTKASFVASFAIVARTAAMVRIVSSIQLESVAIVKETKSNPASANRASTPSWVGFGAPHGSVRSQTRASFRTVRARTDICITFVHSNESPEAGDAQPMGNKRPRSRNFFPPSGLPNRNRCPIIEPDAPDSCDFRGRVPGVCRSHGLRVASHVDADRRAEVWRCPTRSTR